jgi:coproporphyrinogen III oxidase
MPDTLTETSFDERKTRAAAWFRELRDRIVAAFEALEADTPGRGEAAVFEVSETRRGEDGGGGLMSVMRGGRAFEKVGVNVSTVHGTLGEAAQGAMAARGVPGIAEDPRFWASGISLVAHMANPHMPAVHMNTRMFWTPGAWWFGGGSDLNPALPRDEDTEHFHAVLRDALAPWGAYPRFSKWADEYFYIPHRKRARGVGGVFYDDLRGEWEDDFALTRAVGEAFLPAILPIWERRRAEPWDEADREALLVHRGLYAEYNLVYDRGTKFGLATGHDPDAVLMSLPPMARWR